MKLTIVSPEKRIASAIEVSSITLPGSEGQIQILPGHADMIGTLETGEFAFEKASGEKTMGAMSSGFFEVHADLILVTAETCELSPEIDVNRARSAQKKAESALKDPELDPTLFRKYELKLQRALIRQQIAGGSHSSLGQ